MNTGCQLRPSNCRLADSNSIAGSIKRYSILTRFANFPISCLVIVSMRESGLIEADYKGKGRESRSRRGRESALLIDQANLHIVQ